MDFSKFQRIKPVRPSPKPTSCRAAARPADCATISIASRSGPCGRRLYQRQSTKRSLESPASGSSSRTLDLDDVDRPRQSWLRRSAAGARNCADDRRLAAQPRACGFIARLPCSNAPPEDQHAPQGAQSTAGAIAEASMVPPNPEVVTVGHFTHRRFPFPEGRPFLEDPLAASLQTPSRGALMAARPNLAKATARSALALVAAGQRHERNDLAAKNV